MKMQELLSFIIILLFFVNVSKAQIDVNRKNEIRYGLVGSNLFAPNFDRKINLFPRFNDMSLTYLRKIKTSPYMIKAEISGKPNNGYSAYSLDSLVGQGTFYSNALFLGVEKQSNFKHLGLFLGAGIRGSFVKLNADYQLIDSAPVEDFEFIRQSLGIAAQSTIVSNITNNLYIFLTSSFIVEYVDSSSNQNFGDSAELEINGFDMRMFLFDGLGFAYKF